MLSSYSSQHPLLIAYCSKLINDNGRLEDYLLSLYFPSSRDYGYCWIGSTLVFFGVIFSLDVGNPSHLNDAMSL